MSNSFEIITVLVSVLGLLLCLTSYFRPLRALGELGRTGSTWFAHPDERALADRPSEDGVEAPLPRRPLRARF